KDLSYSEHDLIFDMHKSSAYSIPVQTKTPPEGAVLCECELFAPRLASLSRNAGEGMRVRGAASSALSQLSHPSPLALSRKRERGSRSGSLVLHAVIHVELDRV